MDVLLVSFREAKLLPKCKNLDLLPFDFYLPEKNICIEYDGIQHFEPRDFFGGKVEFEKIKIRDKIKTKYCNSNNIILLRIQYDEDVIKSLKENIN